MKNLQKAIENLYVGLADGVNSFPDFMAVTVPSEGLVFLQINVSVGYKKVW